MNSDGMAARIGNLLGSPSSDAAGIPSRPPPPIPNHEIIARIGSGSYGEVWLARSVTGALRAVKVVWRCHFSSDRPYEREFRGIVQFEPISRSHPGVVNVLHVGRDDAAGCFFYVMELADGVAGFEFGVSNSSAISQLEARDSKLEAYSPRTLTAELKSRSRLPVSDAVSLGVQLAGALGHLHRHGLVHRDVKPSNVIFVHGQPKLADIGLVTGVHEERSFVGTEGFIPPEGPGSERADLFALGRLLYEAVTGKNRCDFPGLPDDLDRWPKSEREGLIELNEVLARACAPEAKKRHSNAADLAGDLNLILAGRSVRRAYGIERQLRRATWISVAALVLVLATTFSNWFQRRQRELSEAQVKRETTLREEAQNSLARAEAAERESQQQLYAALLEQSRATVLSGELGHRVRALEAVRRAGAISNSAALRGVTIAALALPDLRFERELPAAPDLILAQLDPAFERIAVGRASGPVEIRTVRDNRLLATLPAITNRSVFAGGIWSADGRFLAVIRDRDTAGSVKDLEVWEVSEKKRALVLWDMKSPVVTFHPRLPRIMVGLASAEAVTWDLETGRELRRHNLKGRPSDLSFAPNGERFAAAERIGNWTRFVIYQLADGAERASCSLTNPAGAIDWHPTGRLIAGGDSQGAIYIMDADTGETRLLGWHKSVTRTVSFSPDGRYLLSGGWDRELICWDVKGMRRAFTVPLDSYRMQFRADGRQCAILRWPEVRLQLYAFEPPALYREFPEDVGGNPNHAVFSPDGRWLAASGAGRRMAVWDLTTNGPAAVLKEALEAHVTFAPNGELFCSRVYDCSRWKVRPGANGLEPILERLEMATPQGFSSLTLISNGLVLTGVRGSRLVGFDDLANKEGTWKRTVAGRTLASPDGQWLAVLLRSSPYLYVHGLPGLEPIVTLTNEARIQDFEFSPKGDELAVGTRLGIEFWNTANWQRIRHLTNFSNILYARDGQTFWLSSGLHTAGLYDARTTELLFPLPANTMPLALSPNGRQLAVSVDSRRVQVWDLIEVRQRLRELGLDWAVNQ